VFGIGPNETRLARGEEKSDFQTKGNGEMKKRTRLALRKGEEGEMGF